MAIIRRIKPSETSTGLFQRTSDSSAVNNVNIHVNPAASGFVDEVVFQLLNYDVNGNDVNTTGDPQIALEIVNATTTSSVIANVPWNMGQSPSIKIHLEPNQLLRFDDGYVAFGYYYAWSVYVNRIQNPA